ncbi:hypothetical protein B566_EDAN015428 [Ephemera danica]|nr:hypothetical protein B566_EDAN015428 [Ephemera danica]
MRREEVEPHFMQVKIGLANDIDSVTLPLREHNGKNYWQCSRKGACKARLHTVGKNLVKIVNEHNHVADIGKIEAKQAYNSMKDAARTTDSRNVSIISTQTDRLGDSSLAILPAESHIKRHLRRIRSKANHVLPSPATLAEFVKPPEKQKLSSGDNFLFFDSGVQDPQRFLVFGTERGKKLAEESDIWAMDGTFKTTPTIFYQLYSLFCKKGDNWFPALYILMSGKTKQCYVKVFQEIARICPEAAPVRATFDYEKGAIDAFKLVFKSASTHACRFHHGQIILRKLREDGCIQPYSTDTEFQLQVKIIFALAFVPCQHVVTAFDTVTQTVDPELQPLMAHLEKYYIGQHNGKTKRKARNLGEPDFSNNLRSARASGVKSSEMEKSLPLSFELLDMTAAFVVRTSSLADLNSCCVASSFPDIVVKFWRRRLTASRVSVLLAAMLAFVLVLHSLMSSASVSRVKEGLVLGLLEGSGTARGTRAVEHDRRRLLPAVSTEDQIVGLHPTLSGIG